VEGLSAMRTQLKWIDSLLPVGIVCVLLPLIVTRMPGKPQFYLFGGLLLIFAHLFLRWDVVVRLVGRRQLRYGSNMLLFSVTTLAILVLVNWVVSKYVNRWDFTKEQRFGLSDQTKKIVKGLKEDVRITYFVNAQTAEGGEERRKAEDQLREYQALSSRIKVDFDNPMKSPAKARAYGITTVPSVVIERGTKQERVTNTTEQDVTNALIKVTRDVKKTVCFIKGQGERDLDGMDPKGYSTVKQALEKNSYTVESADLLGQQEDLQKCTAVVLAGPQADLLPESVERLRAYVTAGGKALVLLEPEYKGAQPNLTGLLKGWNVQTASDVLLQIDIRPTLIGLPPTADERVIVRRYPFHEITKDMTGLSTFFFSARSVEAGKSAVEGVTAQNLLETNENVWAETDLTLKKPNPDKARRGPLPFGVAVTIKVKTAAAAPTPSPSPSAMPEEKPADKEARVVVVGDCDFGSNQLLEQLGNKDLFLNSVAWLAKDSDLISIRAKEPGEQRLKIMTGSFEFWLIGAVTLVILPGLFIVWGIVAWWRRR
jgi:ABC-type uncharacterized transport system involved in gliding motility auxiliary subunit